MSRLDSFIRRLEAQRLCLGDAVARSAKIPGVVLELGLGDFNVTLPQAKQRLGAGAASFVHVDLGSGDAAASAALAAVIAAQVAELMVPGAVLVSDQLMAASSLSALPLPAGVKPGRYYMAQRA